jgi:hypothetical protein
MVQSVHDIIEVGSERHGSPCKSDVIAFTTRAFGHTGKVKLTPIAQPVAMPEVTDSWVIDG